MRVIDVPLNSYPDRASVSEDDLRNLQVRLRTKSLADADITLLDAILALVCNSDLKRRD